MFLCYWKVEKLKWWFAATRRITIHTVMNFTPIFTISINFHYKSTQLLHNGEPFSTVKWSFTSRNKLWKFACSKTVSRNQYLGNLFDPNFQRMNGIFVSNWKYLNCIQKKSQNIIFSKCEMRNFHIMLWRIEKPFLTNQ